jgi:hypothetical protein
MKTALHKLIEQLEEKIAKSEDFAKNQDEMGVFLITGLIAGFMESKLLAKKLLEHELKNK